MAQQPIIGKDLFDFAEANFGAPRTREADVAAHLAFLELAVGVSQQEAVDDEVFAAGVLNARTGMIGLAQAHDGRNDKVAPHRGFVVVSGDGLEAPRSAGFLIVSAAARRVTVVAGLRVSDAMSDKW